jgi:hypothetical protein
MLPNAPDERRVLLARAPLPKHTHSRDHALLRELRQPRRLIRPAEELEASGEVAARRIRELAWDLGADLHHERWMAWVSREMDVPYDTMRAIIHGKRPTVSCGTVDRVARTLRIPVGAFYDPRW